MNVWLKWMINPCLSQYKSLCFYEISAEIVLRQGEKVRKSNKEMLPFRGHACLAIDEKMR